MRKFKRQRGFLTFAQNGKTDYLRMAYALALSLKASQEQHPHLSVVVTPDMFIPEEYRHAFDEIIPIPWLDEARHSEWKLENEWKAYHITPYEETIKLDADMIFPTDVSNWWDVLARQDFTYCDTVETYRGDVVDNDHYRKVFTSNGLPNVYTAFMYFKFSELSEEIFKQAEIIYHNWERFFYLFLDETRPKFVSTDVVFALAVHLTASADICRPLTSAPRFVHMKSMIQDWGDEGLVEDWTKHVTTSLGDDGVLKIGTYRQSKPFHYHVKEFLTDEMIQTLRDLVKERGR